MNVHLKFSSTPFVSYVLCVIWGILYHFVILCNSVHDLFQERGFNSVKRLLKVNKNMANCRCTLLQLYFLKLLIKLHINTLVIKAALFGCENTMSVDVHLLTRHLMQVWLTVTEHMVCLRYFLKLFLCSFFVFWISCTIGMIFHGKTMGKFWLKYMASHISCKDWSLTLGKRLEDQLCWHLRSHLAFCSNLLDLAYSVWFFLILVPQK